MCAIIGVLGNHLPEEKQFIAARDVMSHRGPDDAGLYYAPEDGVALGHRRLSIIDLSEAGHQPFISADGRFVVVYNGEIYNYLELKDELKGRYEFRTRTDTEVLLAAYVVWGKPFLEKLNGMFAFAIWDKVRKELFCARDRLGEKPFFYSVRNGDFYFSSETKGLRSLGVGKAPNEKTIFDYLRYGLYDHSHETFFSDIQRLPAGNYLTWKNGMIAASPYWSLKEVAPIIDIDVTDRKAVKERFRELLTDAIKIRFRSDVPVGLNLSSGLDSNTLLYFSKQILGTELNAFSFCYSDEEFNECSSVARHISTRQRDAWFTEIVDPHTLWRDAGGMNITQGEPFGGIPTLAHDRLFRMARDHNTTVVLEGQGGDEILAGYSYYRPEYEKDKKGEPVAGVVPPSTVSQDASRMSRENILCPVFLGKYDGSVPLFEAPFASHVQNAQYRDIVHSKLPRVLRFHDHMSMAYGRELRLPLLDHRLVEFCFFLPLEYKINGHSQKVLIREAMREYLPELVREAEKTTFSSVQGIWFRNYHKDAILDVLNSDSFKSRGYFDYDALIRSAHSFFKGSEDNSFFLWQCVNLELWFREFVD